MDDSDVEDGDCLGESAGDPAAVEGEDSLVAEVTVLLRALRCLGMAVEDIARSLNQNPSALFAIEETDEVVDLLTAQENIREFEEANLVSKPIC